MALKRVTISFLIETESDDIDIFKAVDKGLKWGMATECVAPPYKITELSYE